MQPQETIRVNSRKIRILLIERDMRPADLARKLGVSRAAISRVLTGQRPNSILPGRIAKALGVRLEEILVNGTNGKARAA